MIMLKILIIIIATCTSGQSFVIGTTTPKYLMLATYIVTGILVSVE